MKMVVKTVKMMVFVAITFATLTIVTNARAQTDIFAGKFALSNEIHWGTVTLPPGEYSLYIHSLDMPGLIWSSSSRKEMVIPVARIADSEKGDARLTIVERDGVLRLMSVNIPSLRLSLQYVPMTASERSSLAKRHSIEAMPLAAEANSAHSLSSTP
jgi:hypothetical protein